MSRYLKHKKQEEKALKEKKLKQKQIQKRKAERDDIKNRLKSIWEQIKDINKMHECKSPYSDDLYLCDTEEELNQINFEGKPNMSLRFSNHREWDSYGDRQCNIAASGCNTPKETAYLDKYGKPKYKTNLQQICIYVNGTYYLLAGEQLNHDGTKSVNIPRKIDTILNRINHYKSLT